MTTDWRQELTDHAPDAALAGLIAEALQALLREDGTLLVRDVNEKAITARLADHVRHRCSDWDVDAEYNRDGQHVKKANGDIVIPDVIVHRRGTPENLLVIEVKKSNTAEPDQNDLEKLAAFRNSHLAYRHALFVKLTVGPEPGIERCEWV